MSEASSQDRTERASPKRRREARERGQIPRSRELGAAAVVLGGAVGLTALGGGLATGAGEFMRAGLSFDARALAAADLAALFGHALLRGLALVAPLLGLLVLLAFGATLLIGGWNFSSKALVPDFSRINPASGLGRLFSSQGLVEMLKGCAKFMLVGTVAFVCLRLMRGEILGLGAEDPQQGIAHAASLMLRAFVWLAAALLVIAAVDVPWQLYSYEKRLRMTKQELREEYKQSEGRPEVKARIRRVQHEMSRRRMMEKVPQADVIVTNPTHYAVALQYAAGKTRAPRVIAKGVDQLALAIRELAAEHRVPVIEAPPLARALYRNCDLDAEIPVNLYSAVAQVLTYVYQLRSWRGGPPPKRPEIGDVPGGEVDPTGGTT